MAFHGDGDAVAGLCGNVHVFVMMKPPGAEAEVLGDDGVERINIILIVPIERDHSILVS